MRKHAPIAVFAYNRPAHVARMLDSLKANPEAASSPIYIYCDGPKRPEHAGAVAQTRVAVRAHAPPHAQIVERDQNLGLAASIIAGVSALNAEYGRAIVLEDDLTLSPTALRYFNQALERYKDDPRAMHVSGYMYPVRGRLPRLFFYREASCWGWATWSRAWERFNPDASALLRSVLDQGLERKFNIDGTMDYVGMLRLQAEGKIDSWAIRWYASMFLSEGLALHPGRSLVRNDGLDGSGVHCDATHAFDVEPESLTFAPHEFPKRIELDHRALSAMRAFRGRPLWRRVAGRLLRPLKLR